MLVHIFFIIFSFLMSLRIFQLYLTDSMAQHYKLQSVLLVLHEDMLLMLGLYIFSSVHGIAHDNIYYQLYFTDVVVDNEALVE